MRAGWAAGRATDAVKKILPFCFTKIQIRAIRLCTGKIEPTLSKPESHAFGALLGDASEGPGNFLFESAITH
jgi:hypothetical protein